MKRPDFKHRIISLIIFVSFSNGAFAQNDCTRRSSKNGDINERGYVFSYNSEKCSINQPPYVRIYKITNNAKVLLPVKWTDPISGETYISGSIDPGRSEM